MIRGKTLGDDELEGRLRRIAVNQCCTLVYTSGTTGNPKAVMMSHDNLTWNAKTASTIHKFEKGYEELKHWGTNIKYFLSEISVS